MAFEVICVEYGTFETRNAYIGIGDEKGMIIDPGNRMGAQKILDTLEERNLSIDLFDTIVLQSAHCSNTSGLMRLSEASMNATIIVNSDLQGTFESFEVKTINELDYEYTVDASLALSFIQTPFLPFPDMFSTYVNGENLLFSSHLFSQIVTGESTKKALIDALSYYHETSMPSSDFLKPVIRDLSRLDINAIYPLKGQSLAQDLIKDVLKELTKLDFYNNHISVSRRNKYNKYDYKEILNHMLKKLESQFTKKAILKVFNESGIVLKNGLSIEIEDTKLKGYKLWNAFFDQLYKRKGLQWLIILEPLVKKYTKLYNINKPLIYKSELMKRQKALSKAREEKSKLEDTVDRLSSQLNKTSEQLLRDPLTSLYNEVFFTQHLANEMDEYNLEDERLGLLLIRVDRFRTLNHQYGSDAGDETIRNLSYIIERVKPENTVLFRQKGPGFFLYFGFSSIKKIKETAKAISNAVKDSELFIKPISVSQYVATTDDLENHRNGLDSANSLINESRAKLERAQSKDFNLILDSKNAESSYKEGYILVIDEDETMQNLLVLIFNRLHYEVILAKDIYEAFEVVKSTPIDTIISEINLSKLDGLQFKRWLNESHTFQSIPFIIASHHKNTEIIKRCNSLNVDFVLKKPIITEELIGLVKRLKKRSDLL